MVSNMADVQHTSIDEEPLASTVAALLDEARWMHDEERLHGERLETRLGLLAGFAGLILAVVAPMGPNAFEDETTQLFYRVSYMAALLLLAGSAGLAISALVRARIVRLGGVEMSAPWRRIGVNDEVLDKFSGEFTAEPTVEVERMMIATLVEGVKDQRELNGKRWNVFRLAAFGLVAALLAVAGMGGVLVFAW